MTAHEKFILKGIEIGQIPKNPIRTKDIDKLKDEHKKMHDALKWLMDNYNDDKLIISSTGIDYVFTENILIDKLLEIQTLINEIKS